MERRNFLKSLFIGAGGFAVGGAGGIAVNKLLATDEGYAKGIREVVPNATDEQVAELTHKQRSHFASGCASVAGAVALVVAFK